MGYVRAVALLFLAMGWLGLGLGPLPVAHALGEPELSARSTASVPPAQFLTLLRRIDETPYRLAQQAGPGWEVASRCKPSDPASCSTFVVCSGLERSYRALLRDREPKWQWMSTSLWAWDYASEAHAHRAEAAIRSYWCVYNEKAIVWREGKLLLVAETEAKSHAAGERAKRHHGVLQQLLGVKPAPPPPQPTAGLRPAARAKLGDLTLRDEQLPALLGGASDVDDLKALNARGMKLLARRDYARAAYAFELAARLGEANSGSYPLPLYNRACVAGRQHDVDEALFWLWTLTKLRDGRDPYCQSRSEEGDKLLQRASSDKDLREVINSSAWRAFSRCVAPGQTSRW